MAPRRRAIVVVVHPRRAPSPGHLPSPVTSSGHPRPHRSLPGLNITGSSVAQPSPAGSAAVRPPRPSAAGCSRIRGHRSSPPGSRRPSPSGRSARRSVQQQQNVRRLRVHQIKQQHVVHLSIEKQQQ
ncbi:hypothetical protein DAI22_04g261600 [Oryza sativa Japonica Group]|nr:hypothetical protein DAI22_04g261600 [Oryza sativa Japonica Group]